MPNRDFDSFFLTPASVDDYRRSIAAAVDVLVEQYGRRTQCYAGRSASDLAALFADLDVCPEVGRGLATVLAQVGEQVLANSIVVSDPTAVAHLHCPTLLPALAAEVLISATNQSMDSWDQGPSATYLEQRVVDWLCETYGLGPNSDGVFTSGGTQSNLMGLLLARDAYCRDRLDWNVQMHGLPPAAPRFRILCSEISHFSLRKSAAILGLGHASIVPVAIDDQHRMCPDALRVTVKRLKDNGDLPIAIAATVGTTDFGSIDPLEPISAIAREEQLWLHADAAYGGALIMSPRHRHLVAGIGDVDSLTVDFHKLFYQPISCGAFFVREKGRFDLFRLHADYLNPESNEDEGVLDLVVKSLQTTRRFDGLKLFITLQAVGRQGISAMIDATMDLAQHVADWITATSKLELAGRPSLNAIVFRYRREDIDIPATNAINSLIRRTLLSSGRALLAQTRVNGAVFLKITLLNPRTTPADIIAVLTDAIAFGDRIDLSTLPR